MTRYLGYSSLTDFFPTMDIKPNPACENPLCRQLQENYQEKYNSPQAVAQREEVRRKNEEENKQVVTHEENEWKIEVVPEDEESSPEKQKDNNGGLAAGLHYELPVSHFYELPVSHFTNLFLTKPIFSTFLLLSRSW